MEEEDIGVFMHWIGSPLRTEGDKTYFGAIENVISKDRYEKGFFRFLILASGTKGKCIYLQPADPKQDFYIAKIEDLYENSNGIQKIIVRWFYRCHDIQKRPPSGGHDYEVYFTCDFDHQPVDSIAGSCQVLPKMEFDSRRASGCANGRDSHTYMCEWVYSNEKDLFTHIDIREGDEGPASNIEHTASGVSEGCFSTATEVIQVLLDIEEQVSNLPFILKWANSRKEWIMNAKNSNTVSDLSKSLLQLEDCLNLQDHQSDRNFGLESPNSWREAVDSVQNYDQLLKCVHSFGMEVKKISEIQGNVNNSSVMEHKDTKGSNSKDSVDNNSSKKRKASLNPELVGKEGNVTVENGCDTSSKRRSLSASKSGKGPVSKMENGKGAVFASSHRQLSIVQDTLAPDGAICGKKKRVCKSESVVKSDLDESENMMDIVKVGSAYEINRNEVPEGAPEELSRACTVMVTRKENRCITIKYPSTQSLTAFFCHRSDALPGESSKQGHNLRNHKDNKKRCGDAKRQTEFGKKALIGEKPELDGFYELSFAEAKRMLVRPVSRMELTHQTHLKRFWVTENDKFDRSNITGEIREAKEADEIEAESEQCQRKLTSTKVTGDLTCGFDLGNSLKKEMQEELQKSNEEQVKRKVKRKNSRPRKSDDGTNKLVQSEDEEMESRGVKECQNNAVKNKNKNKINAGDTGKKINIKADVEKAFSDATEALTKLVETNIVGGSPTNTQGMGDGSYCLGEMKWATKRRATLGSRATLLKTGGSEIFSAFKTSQAEKFKGLEKGIARVGSTSLISPSPRSQSVQWDDTRKESGSTGTNDISDSENLDETDGDENTEKSPKAGKTNIKLLKLPKDFQRRWSNDRYKAAQLKLVQIMKGRGAVPGKPILRPTLREEARNYIGDTGLLDHLLKHMTDTVVSTGERFRRRHNNDGAMEYWLEEADLLEMRQAAGITDPSWVPPPGWRPGTNPNGGCQGTCGGETKGMTKEEASEYKQLKETVASLQGEMKKLQMAAIMDSCTTPIVSAQTIELTDLKDYVLRMEEQLKKQCQETQKNMECLVEKVSEIQQQFRELRSEWETAEYDSKVKDEVKGLRGEEGQERIEELLLTMSSFRSDVMDRLHKVEMELVGLAKEGVGRDEAFKMEKTRFGNEMRNIYTFVQLFQVEINKLVVELGFSSVSKKKKNPPFVWPTLINGENTILGNHCLERKKTSTPLPLRFNNLDRPEICMNEAIPDKSTNPVEASDGSIPFPQPVTNKGMQKTEGGIVQPQPFVGITKTQTLPELPNVSSLETLFPALQRVSHPVNGDVFDMNSNGFNVNSNEFNVNCNGFNVNNNGFNRFNVNVSGLQQQISQKSSCFQVANPPIGEVSKQESGMAPPVQVFGPIPGIEGGREGEGENEGEEDGVGGREREGERERSTLRPEECPSQRVSHSELLSRSICDQKQNKSLGQITMVPEKLKKQTPKRNIARKLDFQESHSRSSMSHEDI